MRIAKGGHHAYLSTRKSEWRILRITGVARPRVLLLPPHRARDDESADAKTHHAGRKSLPATANSGRRRLHPDGADASDGGAASATRSIPSLRDCCCMGCRSPARTCNRAQILPRARTPPWREATTIFEQDYDLADTDCGLRVPEEEERQRQTWGTKLAWPLLSGQCRFRRACKRMPAARAFLCGCVCKTKTMSHNLRRSRGRSRQGFIAPALVPPPAPALAPGFSILKPSSIRHPYGDSS